MSDLDVSLRLRLKNDLSKEADRAEKDLKQLENTAKQLGRSGGSNKLEKEITDIRREAKSGETAIHNLATEARKLNNINTNAAEREIDALGKASRAAEKDIRDLNSRAKNVDGIDPQKFSRIEKPAGSLNSTMGFLAGSAGSAILALGAFASVDNIVRGMEQLGEQARKLNREVVDVAVTAEMRTPEAVAKISGSNEKLSIRYGYDQGAVNDARKNYAAAGFGLDQQEAILDPTLKAAKAGKSTGSTMSDAVIAAQQALGVKDEEVPYALDMMAKGSKLGRFEVDAMAKNFPALATMYGGTGRKGLEGWSELIAAAQIVRKGAGSQDEAATNLQNIISKLSSPDTVKNFKENGVELPDVKAKAEKDGKPYMMAVVDEAMRLSGGDPFKIGELFGDQQAKLALAPLIDNRDQYNAWVDQIRNGSRGGVDEDYEFVRKTEQEKAERRDAAMQATGLKAGEVYNSVVSPLKESVVRAINPDYGRQEAGQDEKDRLKGVDVESLKALIDERGRQLANMPTSRFDVDPLAAQRMTIQQQIDQLRIELQAAEKVQTPADNGDLGKSRGAGFIPIPTPRPVDQELGKDLSGAANKSMQGYNDTLSSEGDKAVAIARDKAAAIRDTLTFTATPTIQPHFLPPTNAPAAAPSAKPDEHSSLQQSSTVKVAQNFYGNQNARLASIRATRDQNREIRRAEGRSLYDLGPKLA